jgi:MFS family permease
MTPRTIENLDYWKYFFVVMLSLIGNGLFLYTQGWYVLDLTRTKLSVGLSWTTFFVPGLFFLPVMGKLLDLPSVKDFLVRLEFIKAFLLLAFIPILHFMPSRHFVYLLSGLSGVAFSVFLPSIYVVLKKILAQEQVSKYSHMLELSIQLASIASVCASGFLYKTFGFLALLGAASAAGISAGMILMTMNIPANRNGSRLRVLDEYKRFFGAFKEIRHEKSRERKMHLFGILHQFPQNVILALNIPLLLYVYETMRKGPVEYGILDGLLGGAAILTGMYWTKYYRKSQKRRLVLGMPLLSSFFLFCITFIPSAGIAPYAVFCLSFIFLTSSKIQCRAAVLIVTPAETMGRMTSFYQTASYAVMLALALGISCLCQKMPIHAVFLVLGALMMGFTLFLKWAYEPAE